MIPDINLEDCISMVQYWYDMAADKYKVTGNFEYVLLGHNYKEIIRHLEAYKKILEASREDDHADEA